MEFSPDEHASLRDLPFQNARIKRGQEIVREGDRLSRCCVLVSGFTCSVKVLRSGRRQIVAIHLRGDLPDMESMQLAPLDFGVVTLTACEVAFIPHDALNRLFDDHPRILRAVWRYALEETAVIREWTLNVGQRVGVARIAHLMCEIFKRMEAIGLTQGQTCELPMTQVDLADATGMSSVHVSRCVKQLRADGVIALNAGQLHVLNWAALKTIADFNADYLYLGAAAAD
jgi:CRP-like cAMP-binding protein